MLNRYGKLLLKTIFMLADQVVLYFKCIVNFWLFYSLKHFRLCILWDSFIVISSLVICRWILAMPLRHFISMILVLLGNSNIITCILRSTMEQIQSAHTDTLVWVPMKAHASISLMKKVKQTKPIHIYIALSRRDGLESLAYTLIYLAKGKLP